MDLRLAPLRQVDDVVPVVVQVLHAAVEVPPQEGAGFSGQRDAPEAQLPSGDRRDGEFWGIRLRLFLVGTNGDATCFIRSGPWTGKNPEIPLFCQINDGCFHPNHK